MDPVAVQSVFETAAFDGVNGRGATVGNRLTIPMEQRDLPCLSSLVMVRRSEELPDDSPAAGSPLHYGKLLLYPLLSDRL